VTPRSYFDDVWQRSDLFTALHGYLTAQGTAVLQPDELLRAEWAMRVSALDLYVHELVAQNLLKIFQGVRPICPGFARLQISSDAMMRISNASSPAQKETAFDLEVRTQLSRITYQFPDDIADGVRMVSGIKLWNEVAINLGATQANLSATTTSIKQQLSLIANRRNKIVHEGDLQPSVPRVPWPISSGDLQDVSAFILRLVTALDAVV